jgi:hypothetical protein
MPFSAWAGPIVKTFTTPPTRFLILSASSMAYSSKWIYNGFHTISDERTGFRIYFYLSCSGYLFDTYNDIQHILLDCTIDVSLEILKLKK